jgi:glycogen debranching enzyme
MSTDDTARLPDSIHDLTATVLAPSAALSGADGQIRAVGMQGVFLGDTRVLRQARLSFDDTEPRALTGRAEGPGRTRFVAFVRGYGDRSGDPTVRVDRVRIMRPDGMAEEIAIRCTAANPVRGVVTVDLICDLLSLELAKASDGDAELPAELVAASPPALVWSAPEITVTVHAPGARVSARPARLAWDIDLAPGAEVGLRWHVRCEERRPIVVAPRRPVEWTPPSVAADEPRLAKLLARALDDLAGLRLAEPRDPDAAFLAAGVPWFLTLFGRDSLWAARMLLPLGTDLAEGTLRVLAHRQGTRLDPVSGEAPGKILHELRRTDVRLGPAAPFPATYYGSVDATPLWISLLVESWRWGLPEAAVDSLLPNLRAALSWLEHYGDPNGDGFVEYLDATGRGLANQGWKDSGGAIRFHDGTLAEPPIALCEVQGYAHRAALDAAALLDALDDGVSRGEADRWRRYAADLSARFREQFWVSGALGEHPALALDRYGRPVDSLTSNIGHLLGTGILTADEEARVAGLLGTDALSDGYGLRTMSTVDRAYAPLSYHCGSIWPHDNAIALTGLSAMATDGADAVATTIARGLLDAAEAFAYRLPELYGGDPRAVVGGPVPHPGACHPQAWSAAAAVALLSSALGLAVDVPRGVLRTRPLPGLGAIDADGLRVGGRTVRIRVDRAGAAEVHGLPATVPHQSPGSRSDAPAGH